MADRMTIDQWREKFADSGKAFTDAHAQRLSEMGLVTVPFGSEDYEPRPLPSYEPAPGRTPGTLSSVSGRAPEIIDRDGEVMHDNGPGFQTLKAMLHTGSGKWVNWPEDVQPESKVDHALQGLGGMLGMAPVVSAMGTVVGPAAAAAGISKIGQAGLTFGAYEGLGPAENLDEWGSNVSEGILFGLAMEGINSVPYLKEFLKNKGGRATFDTALLTVMNKLGNPEMSWGEAAASGAGGAAGIGMSGAGAGAFGHKTSKDFVGVPYREPGVKSAQAPVPGQGAPRPSAKAKSAEPDVFFSKSDVSHQEIGNVPFRDLREQPKKVEPVKELPPEVIEQFDREFGPEPPAELLPEVRGKREPGARPADGDVVLGSGLGGVHGLKAPRTRGADTFDAIGEHALDPVKGSKTSEITQKYRKTGDIDKLVTDLETKLMDGEIRPTDEARIERDVLAEVEGGAKFDNVANEVLRRSLDESLPNDWNAWVKTKPKSLKNVHPNAVQFFSWRRTHQGLGGGGVAGDNMMEKYLVRPIEEIHRAVPQTRDKFNDRWAEIIEAHGLKETADFEAVGKVLETYDSKQNPSDYVRTPEGAWALSGAKNPTTVLRMAHDIRAEYDAHWQIQNDMEQTFNGKDFPYRETYFTKVDGKRPLADIRGRLGDATSRKSARRADTRNDMYRNPRKMHRSDVTDPGAPPREWDIRPVLERYSETTAEAIHFQMGLRHNEAFAKSLEMNGGEGGRDAAAITRTISQSHFNRVPYGIDRVIKETLGSTEMTAGLSEVLKFHRRRFNKAVFTLNPGWSLAVQPSSVALAGLTGFRPAFKAIITMTDPAYRKMADKAFSLQTKREGKGGVTHSGESGETNISRGLTKPGVGERGTAAGQTMSNQIEAETMYYAGAVAYHESKAIRVSDGKGGKRRLTERETLDYISDAMAKTQSEYDRVGRAGILNNQELHALDPAQSFNFELMQNFVEKVGIPLPWVRQRTKIGNYKQYEGAGKKAGNLARGVVMMMAVDAVAQFMFNRELYRPSSFAPYSGPLTGSGIGDGKLYPAMVVDSHKKAVSDIAKGKPVSAATRYMRLYSTAGVQGARAVKTVEAATGHGNMPIEADPVNILMSGLFGSGSTREGRAKYGDNFQKNYVDRYNWVVEQFKKMTGQEPDRPANNRKAIAPRRSSKRKD